MVDYTKPQYRDDTWNRWKGGQKAADELRNFYTTKRAANRIAANNPMAPVAAARPNLRRQLMGQFLGSRLGGMMDRSVRKTTGHGMWESSDGTSAAAPLVPRPGRGSSPFR